MEGLLGDHVLGDMNDITSPRTRNAMKQQCDDYLRVTVDIPAGKVVSRTAFPLQDEHGTAYTFELGSVNPSYWGKDYCYAYGLSFHVHGSPRLEDMGIIKIDLCAAATADSPSVVGVFAHEGVYVGEPIFVPDTAEGAAEDDGCVLVVTRFQDTSTLVVLDGTTMAQVASVQAPFPFMFEFHGQWLADEV
jgi:carotenoid cleavage dioxygenase-like enzyme